MLISENIEIKYNKTINEREMKREITDKAIQAMKNA